MALTKVSGDFIQDGSITQGHLHSSHGITTSDIGEGSNLYFTTARVDSRIGDLSTSDLSEGTNLYYTDARADARITLQVGSNLDLSSKSTSDLSEGTNLYYTQARFNTAFTAKSTSDLNEGTNLYYTDARADARIAAASTSDLSEGTNLYYTDARADARITAADTDSLSEGSTNLYYTDARADARVALIVDSAPGTLDTLNELAAALGDDANFSTTVTNSIATKLPLAGGTMTGRIIQTQHSTTLGNSSYASEAAVTAQATNTTNAYPGYGFHKAGQLGLFLYATDRSTLRQRGDDGTDVAIWNTGDFSSTNVSNWNTAYGWGDHASAGYITSFDITTQTDPKYLRSNAADTLSAAITLDNNGYFVGAPSYGFRFNNSADTINALVVDNSGNSIAYASHRAPIFYDSDDTNYYVNPDSASRINNINVDSGAAYPLQTSSSQRYMVQVRNTANSVNAGYGWWWFMDTNFDMGFHADGASDRFTLTRQGEATVFASMSAPIYYDRNNTNFYVNPASTSNLSTLSTDTNEGIFNNQRRNHSTTVNFNDTSLRAGVNYLQQGSNGPTGTTDHQWYGWRLGLGGEYGTQTGSSGHYAQEWYVARKSQGGNNTGGNFLWTRDMEGGSWGSWAKIDTDRLQLASGYSVVMGSWGLRNVTPSGYIEMGPANTGHAHIYTDRSNFYFNAQIILNGGSVINQNDIRAQIFYDLNDTNYYVNPTSSSRMQQIDISSAGASGLLITHSDIRSAASSNWTGNPGGAGKIQYHANRWYIVSDSSSNRIVQFRKDSQDKCYVDNDGRLMDVHDVRAYEYYDRDDTNYYVNPNGVTRLSGLKLEPASATNQASGDDNVLWIHRTTNNDWGIQVNADQGTATDYGFEFLGGSSHTYAFSGVAAGSRYFSVGSSYAQHDGSFRAPVFYDSNDTGYYVNPNSQSSLWGVAVRGDTSSTNTENQIFFWGSGNTTTSAIGFKANGGNFANPTGTGDGYNTYLTMDTNGRGWVFRRGTGGANFTSAYTSGWILNNGVWQAQASMRAPIFYDSGNTGYYADPAGLSVMHSIKLIKHVNHTPRWDFSAYVVESPHHYSTSGTGHMYIGESNHVNIRSIADIHGDARAPIYYDRNDTGYYMDAASTSNLNAVTLNYINYKNSNFRVGNSTTMNAITSGSQNVAFGPEALGACSTGSRNFAYGYASLFSLSSGSNNIAMGDATGYNVTSGSNNLLFGVNAGRTGYQSPQSIAGVTSGSNQIHMGNESHSTARIQISWTVNSDARDKTDITPIDIGLDFVKQLNPVTYRWDKRSDYEDRTPDGTNKLPELTLGFLAQEVEVVEKSFGYDVANQTNLVVDRIPEQDHYGITYEKMVPILTKAIQEQQTIIDDLKSRLETLENN